MLAVYKRELQSYFLSPTAYIFMGFYMLFSGIIFTTANLWSGSSSYNTALGNQNFIFMMIVPVLTMKLLSEERRSKTDQLLLTAPVSITSIVVGKYLAAITVFIATLVLSLIYPLILAIFGQPAFGEILAGYVGFFLMGCALIAVGIFVSSVTESQVISAIVTFFILLLIWIGDQAASLVSVPFIAAIIKWISVYGRLSEFLSGLLSLTGIIYFISYAAIFIFLAIRSVEKRRWSEG